MEGRECCKAGGDGGRLMGGDCIRAEHGMVLGAGPRWLIWGSGETDGVVGKRDGLQTARRLLQVGQWEMSG